MSAITADGEVQITSNGGTPDYTYQWISAHNDTLTNEDINQWFTYHLHSI